MANSRQKSPTGKNLERPPWWYVLWGVPAGVAILANLAYSVSLVSLTVAGIFYTSSVVWAGVGCFLNGRSCGRVHWRIDGVLFPVLGFAGVLNILSVVSFGWNLSWLAFFVILIGSFIPEWTWKRYS